MEPQQLPDHSVWAASFGGQKALSPFGGRLTFGGIPDQMSISMGYLIGSVRATNWVSKNCMAHGTRGNTDVCFVFVLKHPIWGYAKKGYGPSKRLCRKILFRSCLWPSERSQSPGLFIPRENWFRHAGSPRYGCFIMDTTMKMDDNWGYPIYGDLMKPYETSTWVVPTGFVQELRWGLR